MEQCSKSESLNLKGCKLSTKSKKQHGVGAASREESFPADAVVDAADRDDVALADDIWAGFQAAANEFTAPIVPTCCLLWIYSLSRAFLRHIATMALIFFFVRDGDTSLTALEALSSAAGRRWSSSGPRASTKRLSHFFALCLAASLFRLSSSVNRCLDAGGFNLL